MLEAISTPTCKMPPPDSRIRLGCRPLVGGFQNRKLPSVRRAIHNVEGRTTAQPMVLALPMIGYSQPLLSEPIGV